MSVVWSIEVDGVRKPLASWGIEGNVTLERNAWGVDVLTLPCAGLAIDADPVFAYGALLSLYRDSVRWFHGRVTQLPVFGGTAERHNYEVSGPWWWLENLIYQGERKVAEVPTSSTSLRERIRSSRTGLFRNPDGGSTSPQNQLIDILDFAIAAGAPFVRGTIDALVMAPWEEASDITCAEAAKRCVRLVPDAIQWIDYSTAVPTLHVRRRANLTAATLDVTATTQILELEIGPRHDLVPPGVRFTFEGFAETEAGTAQADLTVQEAGDPDAVGGIIATIELGGQGTDDEEVPPANMAADFFAIVSGLQWQGSLTLKERDCSGLVRVGHRLDLTNGRAAWATMDALVHQTTEDLFAGVTEVTFGPPPQISGQSFLDYLRYQSQRRKTNFLISQSTGSGVSSALPSNAILLAGAGQIDLEACIDGATVTVRVFGTPL